MVFSSQVFLFYFLPAALLVYYVVPRRVKHAGLTLLSYFFYGWSNPYFIVLMFTSTVVDYFSALCIATGGVNPFKLEATTLNQRVPRNRRQKTALAVSICTNLALLGFFKYFNFGVESYNALLRSLGLDDVQWTTFLRVTLPLGISFYTFQSMSYTVDVYRGHARAVRRFVDFACYVSMFPQLVAGPIVRFHEIADQLISRRHTLDKFGRGVAFISLGMAKKILLANPCGKIADLCFGAEAVGFVDAWYGVSAYAFQIYFDFSGYSDMATGLGLMLGFRFPRNFDRPYLAESVTEFWRRWHMSLSRWLRDYLYIPIGGNRRGECRTYLNLALVMLLGGLWHGAGWTFVCWGGFHGALLMIERRMGKMSVYHKFPRPVRIVVTFVCVLISWVFFRSADVPSAFRYLLGLIGSADVPPGVTLIAGVIYQPYYVVTFGLAAWVAWGCRDTWEFTANLPLPKAVACVVLLALSVAAMTTQSFNPFIYFIF